MHLSPTDATRRDGLSMGFTRGVVVVATPRAGGITGLSGGVSISEFVVRAVSWNLLVTVYFWFIYLSMHTKRDTGLTDSSRDLDPVPYSVYDIIYYQNVGVPRTEGPQDR